MMLKAIFFLLCLLSVAFADYAQSFQTQKTGKVSGIKKSALFSETNAQTLFQTNWQFSIESLFNESEENVGNLKAWKEIKNKQKRHAMQTQSSTVIQTNAKTLAANPSIGNNFQGNELKIWTPSDNSMAISNDGKIVNATNFCYDVYDTLGNIYMQHLTWQTFINNTSLTSFIFDPRVIYDPQHDRFILVVLHGISPTESKILVSFSKTNNPMDGWRIYQLSGNPFNNNSWTDFPTIGVNDDELFINGNQFGPQSQSYPFRGSYIYQIGLKEGYQGDSLQFVTWNQILASDGTSPITMYPATNGIGQSQKNQMYFVHLREDTGSNVYVYRIDGQLNDTNKTLTASQYAIPHYEVCADAYERATPSGAIDSLSTGSATIQNAFIVDRTLHFTHAADLNGWCGIHYGRIDVNTNEVFMRSIGVTGSDLAYPATMAFGYDSSDQSAVITYVRSDTSIYPEIGVVSIDQNLNWSSLQVVKSGDTTVNIFNSPSYPPVERWGDYSGIARKFNATRPEVWLAASYGANGSRKASYNTWIAQIKTNEFPTSILKDNPLTETPIIYPNPTTDLFTLEFENKKAGWIDINLIDLSGKIVKKLFADELRESINRLSFNKLMLTQGIYFVQVKRNKQQIFSKKLLIQ
jgi:hypothetical protein